MDGSRYDRFGLAPLIEEAARFAALGDNLVPVPRLYVGRQARRILGGPGLLAIPVAVDPRVSGEPGRRGR